jgi:cell division protein FtsW
VSLHRIALLLIAALIFAAGTLMVFNTSSAQVLDRSLSIGLHAAAIRHLLYGVLAALAGLFTYRLGYRTLLELSPTLLLLTLLCLVALFVPGLAEVRNGARRWLTLGGFSLQPSEFAKVVVPLYAIHFISRHQPFEFRHFLLALIPLGVPVLLIFMEPDNGTTAVLGATLLATCYITRISPRYWLIPFLLFACVAGWAAIKLPYVSQRVAVYLHPETDLLGRGHQPHQAKIAAGSGGLYGRGIGHSMQKLTYLPEAQNDYIAAIFAEETGFVGMTSLILLYATLTALGFGIAHRAESQEALWLATLLTTMLALQAFFNLGVVSGLLPAKGLNLPFFSQGGSSLIAGGMVIGILLSIERRQECVSY